MRRSNPYGHFAFDQKAFDKWEAETHIPQDVWAIAQAVAKQIGIGELEEETIELRNRGGYVYAYTKGIRLTHCTSSYADGPSPDYTDTFLRWMKGLGFYVADSCGDNGMDSATNWHDTYWTNMLGFDGIEVGIDSFEDFVPADKDDEDAYANYLDYEEEHAYDYEEDYY